MARNDTNGSSITCSEPAANMISQASSDANEVVKPSLGAPCAIFNCSPSATTLGTLLTIHSTEPEKSRYGR